MNTTRFVALVVAVAFLALIAQPARAEALEPTTILLVAGAAVVVVLMIAVVVIANVREHQRGDSEQLLASADPGTLLVTRLDSRAVERTEAVSESP